ncbi:ATP-binding protein [Terrihabitans sp. B22-R8]|uniref:ATP-binding protein n=1 Tax=Terrihabitans sp. B22-R8 TaxID=3425128 RepID=UPI00403C0E5B
MSPDDVRMTLGADAGTGKVAPETWAARCVRSGALNGTVERRWDWLVLPGLFIAAFLALEWLSFMHEHKGVPITPWNPGIGLAFAVLLARGPRFGFVVFLGVVAAECLVLQTRLSWPLIFGIATIIAGTYAAMAVVARRFGPLDLAALQDLLVVLGAGLFGAVLVMLLLPAFLLLDVEFEWADVWIAIMPLLLGDMIGIAVMTPLVLRLMGRQGPRISTVLREPEVLLHAGFVITALAIIATIGVDQGARFFYILFVPVILSGVRFGIDGACLALALTQFALVGLLRANGSDAEAFTEFQTLMFVLSTTGLIVGSVVSERQNATARARAAEGRLREMEAEAAQADRFHLVSGMASALAHEINQPMTAVRALVRSVQHILRAEEPDIARAQSNLGNVVAQIDHAGGVLRRMRDFLRRGQPHRSNVEIRSMLEDALKLVEAEARDHRIRITLRIGPGLPNVRADRVQLQQVVLNLVRNAIDAIAGDEREQGRVGVAATFHENPARIEIAVSDDGPGVGEDFAERAFEPLMTSKQSGLGLGLPICVSIVESHGGRVWLQKAQPGATEFRFSLPLNRG